MKKLYKLSRYYDKIYEDLFFSHSIEKLIERIKEINNDWYIVDEKESKNIKMRTSNWEYVIIEIPFII